MRGVNVWSRDLYSMFWGCLHACGRHANMRDDGFCDDAFGALALGNEPADVLAAGAATPP